MQFTRRGGIRVAGFNASYPFGLLKVNSDTIELKCFSRRYVLSKEDIQRISIYRGYISTGLCLEHRISSNPNPIIFWDSIFSLTSGTQALLEKLKSLGYPVSSVS